MNIIEVLALSTTNKTLTQSYTHTQTLTEFDSVRGEFLFISFLLSKNETRVEIDTVG